MKIGIDIRMINNSGIGTYIKNIVPIILNNMSESSFVLYANKKNKLIKYFIKKIVKFNF